MTGDAVTFDIASRPLTVLVTDASYKHSVGIIRALGGSGHRVCAISHHAGAPGFHSRYTTRHRVVANPLTEPVSYADAVLDAAIEWAANVIIPVGFSSVSALVHRADRFRCLNSPLLLPDEETFERCADKWSISRIAHDLGIKTPAAILAANRQVISEFIHEHNRCVAKYRRETDGQGVVYLEAGGNWEDRLATKPVSIRDNGEPNLIIQEWIPGTGRGYMALAWHGRVVREFAHRRLREMPPSGGAATAAVSIDDDKLMHAGRRLIEGIGWHGPAMVEFRSNDTGDYLMELNPKYWGSLELALACGADFPSDHCRLVLHEDLSLRPVPDFKAGVRFWWPWRGDLRRLARRPGDIAAVLRALLSPRTKSNWSWADPIPNLIEMAAELTYPLRRHR